MRVRVRFAVNNFTLPYDYHYALSSAIYGLIKVGDEILSAQLHYSRDIKLHTFSEIMASKRKICDEGIVIMDKASLVFSSPIHDVVRAFVEGILSMGFLSIEDSKMIVESVEVPKTPEFAPKMTMHTLSPIIVSTAVDEKNRMKKWYLMPDDPRWYVNLEKNLKQKYRKVYGKDVHGHVRINVIHCKAKLYKIKGTPVRGAHMRFEISADPELIRLGYEAGFGEKCAQGFGCVDVV